MNVGDHEDEMMEMIRTMDSEQPAALVIARKEGGNTPCKHGITSLIGNDGCSFCRREPPRPAEPRWSAEALARVIFEDWLTEEAACIMDQQSPFDSVIDVMWAKTKPAERLAAERMANRLVERLINP